MTDARRALLSVNARPGSQGISISARGHELQVDEPVENGGHDAGASPVEYLIAGVAATSLVVLGLLGETDVANAAQLKVSASLNIDRVLGTDDAAVFEFIRLQWEVATEDHAERLRSVLPALAQRRPAQALIDAAAGFVEEISVRA